MALRPICEGADLPLLVSDGLDHLFVPEGGFSETAIPPGVVHLRSQRIRGKCEVVGGR